MTPALSPGNPDHQPGGLFTFLLLHKVCGNRGRVLDGLMNNKASNLDSTQKTHRPGTIIAVSCFTGMNGLGIHINLT